MNLDDKKEVIIQQLQIMSNKELLSKQFFKVRAYNKVIEQLKLIESITSFDDISHVKGIGSKIHSKIDEIFKTGKLKSAERAIETEQLQLYEELLKIHGIGIIKAKELVNIYNISSIDKLTKELEKNPSLLNKNQKLGLKYYLDIQTKIPRIEMDKHSKKVSRLCKLFDKHIVVKIVGSYRRGSSESNDIDVLIYLKKNKKNNNLELKDIIQFLKQKKYILEDISLGNKKFMGICRLNKSLPARRIDILLTKEEYYPFTLLYFTGDFQINVNLRKRANDMGYILNEYGLKSQNSKLVPTLLTEKEIFNFLGYKYLIPSKRNIQNLKEL